MRRRCRTSKVRTGTDGGADFEEGESTRVVQLREGMREFIRCLRARGIKEGMTVRIGDMEFDYQD